MKERHPSHITITIPAYKEPNIIKTLESVLECDRSNITLKIDILINESHEETKKVTQLNSLAYKELQVFIEQNQLTDIVSVDYRIFDAKHAGVGLARKTLMDSAANHFRTDSINGVVVALDADCTVKKNYIQAIYQFFLETTFDAASLYFEHPIENSKPYVPIIEYEFHLRYFILMQKLIGLPFAIHTVGSSMACLSETYLAKGGMNKRKAGEDFYFMHKFIKDNVCGILTETTVYPDGRVSDRVPFGTGRAVGKYEEDNYVATTYNPLSFEALSQLTKQIPTLYEGTFQENEMDEILMKYLESIDFHTKLALTRKHTSSQSAFQKRFYQYFDAFQLMKCLHFMRDKFPDITILEASNFINDKIFKKEKASLYESLLLLRKVDAGEIELSNPYAD